MKNLLLFSFLTLAAMGTGYSQNFAYVDSQSIIDQMPEVKEANSNIETFSAQLRKRAQEMFQALQKKAQDLGRRESQGEISPKQIEVEMAKLKEEESEIVQFEQESQQKILAKSDKLLSPIRDRIQKAIDDVAAEKGYDYVFDFSTGFVLYADASTNINQMVLDKLGMN